VADTYEVRVQYPTVEFLGGSQTRDVMAVGYVTKPSLIYFEARIPRSQYSAQQVKNYGIGYSGTIESVAAVDGVAGMQWVQSQQPDGTLLDQMVIFVSSSSGNSSASFTQPFGSLTAEFVAPKVSKLRGQLDAAEGL
jgi:hypothetical protein